MAEITYVLNDLNLNRAGKQVLGSVSELLTMSYEANAVQAAHDEETASTRESDMLNGLEAVSDYRKKL